MKPRAEQRRLEVNGETRTLAEWSRVTGLSYATISNRLRAGMSPHLALSSERFVRAATRYDQLREHPEQARDMTPEEILALRERYPVRWDLPYDDDEACQRFVADHPNGATLGEIGALYGVTRERIRQIEAAALRKLKRRLAFLAGDL